MLVDAKRENVCRLLEKAQSFMKLRSHRGTELDGPAQSAILLVGESVGSIETSSHVSVDKDALSLIHDLANRWDRTAMSRKSRLVLVHLVASYIAGIPFLFMNISIFLLAPLAMLVAVPTCVLGFFRQVSGYHFAESDAYSYAFAYLMSRQYVFALLPAYGFLQSYRYSERRLWPIGATACAVFVPPLIDHYVRL